MDLEGPKFSDGDASRRAGTRGGTAAKTLPTELLGK